MPTLPAGSRGMTAQHLRRLSHHAWLACRPMPPHGSPHRRGRHWHKSCTASTAAPYSRRTAPPHNPTDMAGSPFHELGLKDVMEGMGRVRVRQHVNPLRTEFQAPMAPPDWSALFSDPSLPLVVDLGCGPGRFLLLLQRHMDAQRHAAAAGTEASGAAADSNGDHAAISTRNASDSNSTSTSSSSSSEPCRRSAGHPLLLHSPCNYLGIEIRKQLVERANKWAESLGCQQRVQYLFGNATASLGSVLSTYPGPLVRVTVQFPDPHFKRRHHKRRIIQAAVVDAVRDKLQTGGEVFLQSDVYEAATAMRDAFEQHAGDAFGLAPVHCTAPVFRWTDADQAAQQAAARAASATTTASSGSGSGSGGGASDAGGWDADDEDGPSSSSSGGGSSGGGSGGGGGGGVAFESRWAAAGWLQDNPLGVPTEREHYVQQGGGTVYRLMLARR